MSPVELKPRSCGLFTQIGEIKETSKKFQARKLVAADSHNSLSSGELEKTPLPSHASLRLQTGYQQISDTDLPPITPLSSFQSPTMVRPNYQKMPHGMTQDVRNYPDGYTNYDPAPHTPSNRPYEEVVDLASYSTPSKKKTPKALAGKKQENDLSPKLLDYGKVSECAETPTRQPRNSLLSDKFASKPRNTNDHSSHPYSINNQLQHLLDVDVMNRPLYPPRASRAVAIKPPPGFEDVNSTSEARPAKPLAAAFAELDEAEKIVGRIKQNHYGSMPPHIYGPAIRELSSDIISSTSGNYSQLPGQVHPLNYHPQATHADMFDDTEVIRPPPGFEHLGIKRKVEVTETTNELASVFASLYEHEDPRGRRLLERLQPDLEKNLNKPSQLPGQGLPSNISTRLAESAPSSKFGPKPQLTHRRRSRFQHIIPPTEMGPSSHRDKGKGKEIVGGFDIQTEEAMGNNVNYSDIAAPIPRRPKAMISSWSSMASQIPHQPKAMAGTPDSTARPSTHQANVTMASSSSQVPEQSKATGASSHMATEADIQNTFPSYRQPDTKSRIAAGNSKQLNSGQTVINQQFTRFQQYNKHNQVDKSPFIPKSAGELQAHHAEFKQWKNEESLQALKNQIAQKTGESDGTIAKVMPAFGGKKFTDGRSAVLALPTIFKPLPDTKELSEEEREKAKEEEIQWPSLQERKSYGEKQAQEGNAREFPPPRYNEIGERHLMWLLDQGVDEEVVMDLNRTGDWSKLPWEFRRICVQHGLDEVDFERNMVIRARNTVEAANGYPFDSETAFRGMTPFARKEWEDWLKVDETNKKWEAEMKRENPAFERPVKVFESLDPAIDVEEDEGIRLLGGDFLSEISIRKRSWLYRDSAMS